MLALVRVLHPSVATLVSIASVWFTLWVFETRTTPVTERNEIRVVDSFVIRTLLKIRGRSRNLGRLRQDG